MDLLTWNLVSVFYFSITYPFHLLAITVTYDYNLALHRCVMYTCQAILSLDPIVTKKNFR